MTDKLDIKSIGFPELYELLKDLDDVTAADNLRLAGVAGAEPIRNEASRLAPRRTGNLRRSIHIEVVESSRNSVEVEIGTDLEYAAIHEFGGTITPKKAKMLTIPLTETARSYTAPNFPDKLHKQGMALVDAAGQAQYALAFSVNIPARPYLRPAFDTKVDEAVQAAGNVLKKLVLKGRAA